MVNCPRRCGLTKFSTNHRNYTCDSCNSSQGLYAQMFGCRTCNYDLCSKCYNAKSNVKKGSTSKIRKIFQNGYADPEDPEIMSESGMLKFFKDCGVNPESYHTLIISYFLDAAEMGIYEKDEFIKGFVDSGCSTKKDMKKAVQDRISSIENNGKQYKQFYKWLFQHLKEDEKKKSISTALAIQVWSLVFHPKRKYMGLLGQWLTFCEQQQDKDLKVISRDVWEQMYDFLLETQVIDDNYDDAGGAWPVVVDEFVEWIQEQK